MAADDNNNDNAVVFLIAGIRPVKAGAGKFIDRMRAQNPNVHVQAVDAQAVFGRDHAEGVLHIALEAYRRGVMIAGRVETEILLRAACTDQIADALKKAGLKDGRPGCVIAFSGDRKAIEELGSYLEKVAGLDDDDGAILPTPEKRKKLAKEHGIKNEGRLLESLLEKAAILVKG